MSELYIGLMSGTSIDGIDASLVEFKDDDIQLVAFEYQPFSPEIKEKIQQLSQPQTPILLTDYGLLDEILGSLFAKVSNDLLEKTQIASAEIVAIGSHGQTICHSPELYPSGFSLQIGDPNRIAEETGITTVADFRRRDIAAGGQGAPLVPIFHQAVFSSILDLSKQNISIINIGGIANITHLNSGKTTGFDTGPGNALMDYWVQKNLNKPYDKDGAWAKSGKINFEWVDFLKQDEFLKQSPPKSTGKEYFSPDWLHDKIKYLSSFHEADIQASLCQLTADTITDSIKQYAPLTGHTLICGGGAHNSFLMELIRGNLDHPVNSTSEFGINPDHVEAMAFAWLARQTINSLPGNLTKVTGANRPVILGGIYSGSNGFNRFT